MAKHLNFNYADVTDAALEDIVASNPDLEDLDISGTDVTDDGVLHLHKLTELRHLRIKETNLTERGVKRLAFCRALETLNLKCLPMDDEALWALSRLPQLQQIVFYQARFGAEAIRAFRAALPNCEVIIEGRITDW